MIPADLTRVQLVTDPQLAPDGRRVAFVVTTLSEERDEYLANIWIVDLAGGAPRRFTAGPRRDLEPRWSPDGTQLAFLSERAPKDKLQLYLMPADGGEPAKLTALDNGVTSVVWSPDGRRLAFLSPVGGEREPESEEEKRKSRPPRVITSVKYRFNGEGFIYDRRPHVFVVGIDGSAPVQLTDGDFAASSPVAPAEVFVCRADGHEERQLTQLNKAWTDEVALSSPERFRFTRAGLEIDCWVMRPAGFVPGRRYPTLLCIHGGPHAQYGHVFFDEFQVYAGAGYAVIFANPRGGQGYGEAFAEAVVGDWGGGDYADVMAAVDEALRRHPFIDPDRLGVLGGSYGGFLTSWIVGHTDRFKAACSERAVNCQYTMFGTSDIGHSFNMVEMGGPLPWEDLARYIERSPLTYAKNIVTPLLIIHSEDDLRCPIEQAEQLFVALKKLRREVRFVRFPGENHEMSRSGKPRHRLERFRHILEWFDAHLEKTPS